MRQQHTQTDSEPRARSDLFLFPFFFLSPSRRCNRVVTHTARGKQTQHSGKRADSGLTARDERRVNAASDATEASLLNVRGHRAKHRPPRCLAACCPAEAPSSQSGCWWCWRWCWWWSRKPGHAAQAATPRRDRPFRCSGRSCLHPLDAAHPQGTHAQRLYLKLCVPRSSQT